MNGIPFTPNNFGLGGQLPYGPWDEFICFTKKCRDRRDERRDQRAEKRDLQNDKRRLKNQEREAEIIRTQTETNLLAGSIANDSNPAANTTIVQRMSPPEAEPEEFDYLPWLIGGGIALLALGTIGYRYWRKKKSIPASTSKAIP